VSLNAFGRALQERDFHEEALALLSQATAVWTQAHDADAATGLNNLGLSLVALHRWPEAEQALLEAIRIAPSSPYPFYWLAKLYQQRSEEGDASKELAAWRQYLELGATTGERQAEAMARLAPEQPHAGGPPQA
jgi:tetratricopeptide (TPR) repeat protein